MKRRSPAPRDGDSGSPTPSTHEPDGHANTADHNVPRHTLGVFEKKLGKNLLFGLVGINLTCAGIRAIQPSNNSSGGGLMILRFPPYGSFCPLGFVIHSMRVLSRHRCVAFPLAAMIVAAWPAIAAATPIGASAGPGPSTTSMFNLAGTGWVIDDGSFPASLGTQEVAYDSSAGPWHKILSGGDGGDFAASDTGSGALMTFSVIEYVTVGGTTPWTDWHESVMQPGWRWLDDRAGSGEPSFAFASGAPIPGLSVAFTDPTLVTGGKIDFTFDPLPPGTHLKIAKRLVFEGLDPLLPGETFLGKMDVFQHPSVPEPVGLLMALQSAVALMMVVALVNRRGFAPRSRRT
jgi:hypothetical protein